jgi:DNA-binding Lrp family transcriptional regulator
MNKVQTSTVSTKNMVMVSLSNVKPPQFIQKKGKEWILFGEENDYPSYLIDLFNKHSIHNSVLTAKATYLAGLGFEVSENLDEIQKGKITAKLEEIKANETLRRAAIDLELFNGIAIQPIAGKGNIKLAGLAHVDFSKIRSNKDKDKFAYCSEWTVNGAANSKPEKSEDFEELSAFDPEKISPKSIFYYKVHRPGMSGNADIYPLPDYIGCVADIETDINITNFHYNNTKNGFSAGKMVVFKNGVPTPEEQKIIERKLKNKYTGPEQAGEIVMVWMNPSDGQPEVLNLQSSDLDKQFKEIGERIQQNIFTGHKVVSPMLFGVRQTGQLGGRSEMMDAFELFNKTYIIPRRQLLEDVFSELFSAMGIPKGSVKIKPLQPLNLMVDPAKITEVMTEDEIRATVGLKPKPKEAATQVQKMASANTKAIFSKYAKKKADFVIVKSRSVRFGSHQEALESELEWREENFAVKTSALEKKVLDILTKEPKTPIAEIAKALKVDVDKISEAIKYMTESGLITEGKGKIEVTDEGKGIIQDSPPQVSISVMYSYEVRKDVPEAESGSREFCQDLMSIDGLYTRKDIEKISTEMGFSVWDYRGGFYTNPDTGRTTPFCRHKWDQHVVTERRK